MSLRSLSLAAGITGFALLSACSDNPVASVDAPDISGPALLIGPDGTGFHADSVDAYGNTILIQEIAAGVEKTPTGDFAPVASVTVRSFIPFNPGSSSGGACITSTIVGMEALPGNTLTVKKSGGCDKDIVVLVEQKATKRKATFSFSMIFGKTIVDSGLLK